MKKKKHSSKAWQEHTKHVCKNSGSNSQKQRGHWHLKEFWVSCLNQPVTQYSLVQMVDTLQYSIVVHIPNAIPGTALWLIYYYSTV